MASSAFAHHSFEAEYDLKKPITLAGTVAKVDWMNPHIFIHIDVKDENGKVAHWMCEGGNPSSLTRAGWKRTSLKAGDEIVISGYRAKDGTNTCNGRTVKLADGSTETLWHLDLYRLKYREEVEELGLRELWPHITLIEWPEIIVDLLPEQYLDIAFDFGGNDNTRSLELSGGEAWQERLDAVVRSFT